jgi:hypothetical protein
LSRTMSVNDNGSPNKPLEQAGFSRWRRSERASAGRSAPSR